VTGVHEADFYCDRGWMVNSGRRMARTFCSRRMFIPSATVRSDEVVAMQRKLKEAEEVEGQSDDFRPAAVSSRNAYKEGKRTIIFVIPSRLV
jgi:hypothetical protein